MDEKKTIEQIEKSFDERFVDKAGGLGWSILNGVDEVTNIKHFYREEISKLLSGLMMEEKIVTSKLPTEEDPYNLFDMDKGYNIAVSELNTKIKKLLERKK